MACLVFFINSLDISGCRGVTFPVDESNEEVTERLREKIKKGEYTIGELVVLKNLLKLSCVEIVLKIRWWKLGAEKSTLPTFGRNYLKKKKKRKIHAKKI